MSAEPLTPAQLAAVERSLHEHFHGDRSPRWIACAERLPHLEDRGRWLASASVLVFLCGSVHIAHLIRRRSLAFGEWDDWQCGEESYAADEATHWMPLPEPPR